MFGWRPNELVKAEDLPRGIVFVPSSGMSFALFLTAAKTALGLSTLPPAFEVKLYRISATDKALPIAVTRIHDNDSLKQFLDGRPKRIGAPSPDLHAYVSYLGSVPKVPVQTAPEQERAQEPIKSPSPLKGKHFLSIQIPEVGKPDSSRPQTPLTNSPARSPVLARYWNGSTGTSSASSASASPSSESSATTATQLTKANLGDVFGDSSYRVYRYIGKNRVFENWFSTFTVTMNGTAVVPWDRKGFTALSLYSDTASMAANLTGVKPMRTVAIDVRKLLDVPDIVILVDRTREHHIGIAFATPLNLEAAEERLQLVCSLVDEAVPMFSIEQVPALTKPAVGTK